MDFYATLGRPRTQTKKNNNQDINAIQSRGTADSFLVIIVVASYLSDSVSLAFLVFNLLCVNSSVWADRIKLSVAIMH